MTEGQPNFIENYNLDKKKRIAKIKKKKNMDQTYKDAIIRTINNDENINEIESEKNLLYHLNNIINVNKKDSESYMEINEISEHVYKQEELNLYNFCSNTNNFNLMKIIWEWVELVYKQLVEFTDKYHKKNTF